jgi:pentatricopeptide repeat protein
MRTVAAAAAAAATGRLRPPPPRLRLLPEINPQRGGHQRASRRTFLRTGITTSNHYYYYAWGGNHHYQRPPASSLLRLQAYYSARSFSNTNNNTKNDNINKTTTTSNNNNNNNNNTASLGSSSGGATNTNTSTTRTVGLDAKWMTTIQRLVDDRSDVIITPMIIHQFQEALKYCQTQQELQLCWDLLEALVETKQQLQQQQQQQEDSISAIRRPPHPPLIPMHILQPIIHLWQRQFKHAVDQEDHQRHHHHHYYYYQEEEQSPQQQSSQSPVKPKEPSTTTAPSSSTTTTASPPPISFASSSSSSNTIPNGLWFPSHLAQRLEVYQQLGIIPSIKSDNAGAAAAAAVATTPQRKTQQQSQQQQQQQYVPAQLLDVASHLSHRLNRDEGVYFAHDYLQRWIQEYLEQPQIMDEQQTTTTTNTTIVTSTSSIAPPDVVVIGTVLQAWAQSGLPDAPQRAEQLFEDVLRTLVITDNNNSNAAAATTTALQPNEFWYNSILSAWAKQGNVSKAMEWLQRMRDDLNVDPDLATWNSLLSAWAKLAKEEDDDDDGSGKSNRRRQQRSSRRQNTNSEYDQPPPEQMAESILQQMQELYDQGRLAQPPNVISYSIVLDAWSQRAWKNPHAAQRAHQWLQQMKTTAGVQPNRISYNTVIQAYARAGKPHQAEALLLEMMEGGVESQDELNGGSFKHRLHLDEEEDSKRITRMIRPDEVTVAAVLTGWSHVGTWEAAERAERILHELLPQLGLRPDVVTYSTCLACWAKIPPKAHLSKRQQARRGGKREKATSHSANAMERAQSLFDELQEKHPDVQADVVAYTNLMNVYARHGKAERVESILQDLLQAYQNTTTSKHDDQGDPRLKPNVHTFSVVVSAWSRSPRADGAQRAQEWLHRMAIDFGVTPNVVSYTTVLNAWSQRAKQAHQAPDRARELLMQMESSLNPSLKPNSMSYAAVLRAYAQQGRANEAEALLEDILAKNLEPDAYIFSAVLQAWTKTPECSPVEAAQRAETLLMRMHDLYYHPHTKDETTSQVRQSNNSSQQPLVREPPNVVCFSNVLNCWSRVPEQGAERAEAILRAMEKYGVSPNLFCINIVINAWSERARNDNTAVDRARALLDQILTTTQKNKSSDHADRRLAATSSSSILRPDEYTYRAMCKAIFSSTLPNRLELAEDLLVEMQKQGIAPSQYILDRLKDTKARRK